MLSSYTMRLIILTSLSSVASYVGATTYSLASDADLLAQRTCVQICMEGSGTGVGHDSIIGAVGCANVDTNECFCRQDLRLMASSYVSSCLTSDFSAPARTARIIAPRYLFMTGTAASLGR